jgi:hypothetical protein
LGRYQERAEKVLQRTLMAIATGLLLGAATLLLTVRLGVVALALPIFGIAVLRRSGLAVGAGVLVSFGLGYIWAIAAANERCAEFNRQPNAGCQTYGTDEQFILASCVAALGLLLAVFALARQRRQAKGARP